MAFRGFFKDDHIFRLTDDTGMFQHTKNAVPDPAHGYTTDDNARALILALMLYERYEKKKYIDLAYKYSSFILNAQNEKGKFKNFMGFDRKWLEEEGSEDCFGRCLWALGFAIKNQCTPKGIKDCLTYVLNKALPNVSSLKWHRAKAYAVIGLALLETNDSKELVFDTALSLCRSYDKCKDGEWMWFEDKVTYCNSVLPWSLFAAYRATGEKRFLKVALESLEFLEKYTFKKGFFKPIGCKGWFLKGGKPAEFDEQPVEACETALTYLEAYEVTGEKKYKQKSEICHAWYEGRNSKDLSLIDADTGGCFDGLTEYGINPNMGAESLISCCISSLVASDM